MDKTFDIETRRQRQKAFDDLAISAEKSSDEIYTQRPIYSICLYIFFALAMIAGSINLYSASGGDLLFNTHAKHAIVSVVIFIILVTLIRPKHLIMSTFWVYGAILLLLISVLVIGHIGGGSRRWLNLGPINGQPSELAKIAIAMVTARFFAESRINRPYKLRDIWPLGLLLCLYSGLIFPQPDLGTASFLGLILIAQLCFVRVDFKSFAIVISGILLTIPVLWRFFLLDYQKMRILSFLDPSYEPQGKGYNVLQSLVAVGSGGFYGKGFMNGTQTHLKFLPMSHSDFIFSVFSEEYGFIGSSLVVISFATIGCIALLIAKQSKNTFCSLLAIGLGAFIFIEFAINVAMVLRMFPVKGLPLPFFSFGGSNLITSTIAVALLIVIDRDNRGRFKSRNLHLYKN
jgi:rod shape determining protein RodA